MVAIAHVEYSVKQAWLANQYAKIPDSAPKQAPTIEQILSEIIVPRSNEQIHTAQTGAQANADTWSTDRAGVEYIGIAAIAAATVAVKAVRRCRLDGKGGAARFFAFIACKFVR